MSCYTGLRVSDVRKLTKSNIHGRDLSVKMQKVKKPILVPLSYKAQKLINTESAGELLFPKPLKQSKSRVNKDIKEVMELAGIKKHITFHCSRHSFAINSLVLGIDITVISNILGHTSLKTTQI